MYLNIHIYVINIHMYIRTYVHTYVRTDVPEAIKTLPKSPRNPPPTPSQNPPQKTPQNRPPKNTYPAFGRKFPGVLAGPLPTVPLPPPTEPPSFAHGREDNGVSC